MKHFADVENCINNYPTKSAGVFRRIPSKNRFHSLDFTLFSWAINVSSFLVSMTILLLDESFDKNKQATYKKPGWIGRYAFYVFYPTHLAVL
jgi:hypothetical protein